MPWSNVSERRWERPLDTLEMAFFLIAGGASGGGQLTVFSRLKLTIDMPNSIDAESTLRQAWKQVRFQQPHLASTVDRDRKKFVYEVPDNNALQEWLRETFIVSSAASAEEEYQSQVAMNSTSMRRPTLVYEPKSSELLFRGPHSTIDGIGLLLFWHYYLTAVVKPMAAEDILFGTEPSRLPPTKEELLGCPEELTLEQVNRMDELYTEFGRAFPGICPVSKGGKASAPGRCMNEEVVFSARTTEAIVQGCKKKGISVTAAVQAARIMALVKSCDPKSNQSSYAVANNFNLRPYMPKPYNKYAVALYFTAYGFFTGLPTTFWDVAKELSTHYKRTFKDNPGNIRLAGHHFRRFFEVLGQAMSKAVPMTEPVMSSLGVVESFLQRSYSGPAGVHVELEDIKSGCDIRVTQGLFLICTFRDQLRLVHSFNEALVDPATVRELLDEIKRILDDEILSA